MELKKVLFIEDNDSFASNVKEEFRSNNVDVIHIRDDSEIDTVMSSRSDFQLVVMDWLLDGESSLIARLCLTKIRNRWFVPVIIWTEELDIFKGEADDIYKDFPAACIRPFSKNDVTYKALYNCLIEWYQSPPMNFFEHFRQGIYSSIETAFYKLAEQSLDDLVRGLKTYLEVGSNSKEVDVDHAVGVIFRLIEREVYLRDRFIDEFKEIIRNLNFINPPQSKRDRELISKLQDLYMYFKPRPDDAIIRTGDMLEINLNDKTFQAIVMTPACDLANAGKTVYLTMNLIHEAQDEGDKKKLDKWAYVDDGKTFLVCHHEILVAKNITLEVNTDPDKKSIMLYSHQFTTISGEKISFKRTKRLEEPYRSDLLHHYVSYAGRIGVPDFSSLTLK